MNLEDEIDAAFVLDDLTTINLFRNGDGFQCNVTHRKTGTYGTSNSKNPVKAISKAIEICTLGKNGIERSKKPLAKPAADDLL